jgi:hydroxyacid-oxoacid transhydrogenase
MTCAHGWAEIANAESVFTIDASAITFGRGAIAEIGSLAFGVGAKRVALFTDRGVARTAFFAAAQRALRDAKIDFAIYDNVKVEPTDVSFMDAVRFAKDGRFDAYVSVGGGSVMDTCKAAMLYATFPAEFLTYVNKPVGGGQPVPGVLPPHIACPTTCGTGSELTGIAVCDVLALKAKTGIASRRLRPTFAVVDPDATRSLPSTVVAASGFDVLCHAVESFTARPFVTKARAASPNARAMSQGRNPWSDVGSAEALRVAGAHLVRAVRDASDDEARERLAWAATLAGVAFGNAGVHVPHAMAYAVAGLVRDFKMPGYPDEEPMVPHGISVVTSAPSALRATAPAAPERHLRAAEMLGEDVRGASDADAGPLLAGALERLMRAAEVPVGLASLGYRDADVDALTSGTVVQARLLDNAPLPLDREDITGIFRGAIRS